MMSSCSRVHLLSSFHLGVCLYVVHPRDPSPRTLSHFPHFSPSLSLHHSSTPHTPTPPSSPPACIRGTHTHHCSDRATLVIIRDIQLWRYRAQRRLATLTLKQTHHVNPCLPPSLKIAVTVHRVIKLRAIMNKMLMFINKHIE